MGIIVGLNSRRVGSGSQVQSDWNQTDDTQPDYIKNKPNISGGGMIELASTSEWLDISNNSQEYESQQALLDAIGMSEQDFNAIASGEKWATPLHYAFNNDDAHYETIFYPISFLSEGDSLFVIYTVVNPYDTAAGLQYVEFGRNYEDTYYAIGLGQD